MTDPRPALLDQQCQTCIFRPGNQMSLRPGRLKEMVDGAVRTGGSIICHSTIDYDTTEPHDAEVRDYRPGEAMCRGFYDTVGHRSNFVRVMERLGGFREVPAPTGSVHVRD